MQPGLLALALWAAVGLVAPEVVEQAAVISEVVEQAAVISEVVAAEAVAPEVESRAASEDGSYLWRLPAGFPEPVVPADNPMTATKVELGRYLFFDPRLSGNGTVSCASCHRPELGFTDGRAQASGATGELHRRGAMSLVNVAYSRSLTWADPGMSLLEQQALIPMFNLDPIEMGLAGHELDLPRRLKTSPLYAWLFPAAYPGEPDPFTLDHVVRALATFERTLISGNSPYDRFAFQGEEKALSVSALRGMRLFGSEELSCAQCHSGFAFSGPVRFVGRTAPAEGEEAEFHNTGLYNLNGTGRYPDSDRGLIEVTGRDEDEGRFRVPTLRNVAVTAPYMHDGSIATLEEVVAHYAAGGRASGSPHKSSLLRGFAINREQTQDLIAFLRALTDEDFLRDERFADPWRGELPLFHLGSGHGAAGHGSPPSP